MGLMIQAWRGPAGRTSSAWTSAAPPPTIQRAVGRVQPDRVGQPGDVVLHLQCLAEAGIESIPALWSHSERVEAAELRDRIGNKMIRPTTIPETLEELVIEQAIRGARPCGSPSPSTSNSPSH